MSDTAKPIALCVDDDADIRDWMEAILSGHGWDVVTADAGLPALLAARKQTFDLILLDVTMPDLTGYEVCSRLQDDPKTATIPVIFVTALGDEEDKIRAFRVGAADYLVKPIQEKSLFQMVDLHLVTSKRWKELTGRHPVVAPAETKVEPAGAPRWDSRFRPSEFSRFKEFLAGRAKLSGQAKTVLGRLSPAEIYAQSATLQVPERVIAESMAQFLALPYREQIDPKGVRLGVLPTPFCKSNSILPVVNEGPGNSFVLSNPFNWEVQEAVKRVLQRGESPTLILAEPAGIQKLLAPGGGTTPAPDAPPKPAAPKEPPRKMASISELEAKLKEEYVPIQTPLSAREGSANEDSAPIIQLVNSLIEAAYMQGASDIHIEPAEEEVVVRYRVDGDMRIVNRLKPARLIQPMVARLKIMANLDIAEHRMPQDGRIIFKQYSRTGADFDLRLAIAPMNFGEKAVMRILDKQKSVLPLTDLGFSPRNLELYREKIAAPFGMVLHVGPTGSGKSMTLYAALNEIKNPSINIHTAEDPIEYTLPGINQLQVHKEIGLTFARALRSFLRLDPDVILVGEIRDRETADIAIEASLTGHLLLSTLHTNDAPATITRFVEMGVEPYMLSSSVLVICAQRLIRRLCKHCKEAYAPDAMQRQFVGAPASGEVTLYKPKGCEKCNGSGYKGRVGIHEVLAPDDEFRVAVNKHGVTTEELKRIAVHKLGMTTLFWDAMEKVRAGLA
ncbi:MAG: Flp pilus assembly complex ATPase component TadA, partial [Planctomycetaceae bacterium]|nr:Flp pilus assembly complex ATPase component TadA [Planctomycetaceae bacterium]